MIMCCEYKRLWSYKQGLDSRVIVGLYSRYGICILLWKEAVFLCAKGERTEFLKNHHQQL
jgi:hypothetical protein